MPFMDGLELSRLIKKEMPWIKIIILSGYGEFEYAKEAINIGVTEYLLKPINGTELMKSLLKVKENILNERREKANIERFKKEIQEYEEDEKRRIFYDLVNNSQPLGSILERGNELNLKLSAVVYNIILFTIDHTRKNHRETMQLNAVNRELKQLFDISEDIIKFDLFMDGMALLLKGNSLEDLQRKQEYYINRIREIMDNYKGISYFGGIGVAVNRLGDANNAGLNIELDAILAVAIGGNSLGGGKFTLIGSVIGAITIQALTTSLYAMKVTADQLPVYKAIVVVIIVAIQSPVVKRWMKAVRNKNALSGNRKKVKA